MNESGAGAGLKHSLWPNAPLEIVDGAKTSVQLAFIGPDARTAASFSWPRITLVTQSSRTPQRDSLRMRHRTHRLSPVGRAKLLVTVKAPVLAGIRETGDHKFQARPLADRQFIRVAGRASQAARARFLASEAAEESKDGHMKA
ncbi:MAG TPA: hypothetical protein VEF06_03660, partial [Bryobacteraceae bacterium]|nr:hypothetical protein [Bryobacteraceae bacterium]